MYEVIRTHDQEYAESQTTKYTIEPSSRRLLAARLLTPYSAWRRTAATVGEGR